MPHPISASQDVATKFPAKACSPAVSESSVVSDGSFQIVGGEVIGSGEQAPGGAGDVLPDESGTGGQEGVDSSDMDAGGPSQSQVRAKHKASHRQRKRRAKLRASIPRTPSTITRQS